MSLWGTRVHLPATRTTNRVASHRRDTNAYFRVLSSDISLRSGTILKKAHRLVSLNYPPFVGFMDTGSFLFFRVLVRAGARTRAEVHPDRRESRMQPSRNDARAIKPKRNVDVFKRASTIVPWDFVANFSRYGWCNTARRLGETRARKSRARGKRESDEKIVACGSRSVESVRGETRDNAAIYLYGWVLLENGSVLFFYGEKKKKEDYWHCNVSMQISRNARYFLVALFYCNFHLGIFM